MAKTQLIVTAGLVLLSMAAAAGMHQSETQTGGAVASRSFGAVSQAQAAPSGGDLFAPIASVLRDPRCMNCHPRDERPRQGDDRHIHQPNVVRGPDNLGFVNMRCTSCHGEQNNVDSGVPGAPTWHLAPLSMGWQGLSDTELCTVLKDEKLNGGKTIAALVEHIEKDKLVLWGWEPGGKRAPVAVPHAQFVTQFKQWASADAPCPSPKN